MPRRKETSDARFQQSNTYRRMRSFRACVECRRRKRKCNGERPCSSCDGFGYHCTYRDGPTPPPAHEAGDQAGRATTVETAETHEVSPQAMLGGGSNSSEQGGRATYHSRPADDPEGRSAANVMISRERRRVISAHSATALPRMVGYELNDANPPRLHSFAWNLGLRPERHIPFQTRIGSFLSLDECRSLSRVFFGSVHPTFAFLRREAYLERLESSWASMNSYPGFEAIVSGVVGLASFFSFPGHPREAEIVRHAFSILDLNLMEPLTMLDMDCIAGWILRTLYLRLTTRPSIACMSSSTTMHIVEILSLHRDLSVGTMNNASDRPDFGQDEMELRRRYHWVAWSLNCLINIENGLNPVSLPDTTCPLPAPEPDTHTDVFIAISRLLHSAHTAAKTGACMEVHFQHLDGIEDSPSPILSLFKADAALCLLRSLLSLPQRPSPVVTPIVTRLLQRALDKGRELLTARLPWWNILSIPFQTVCICLSLDTQAFLALLPPSLELLDLASAVYGSHLAREALGTARHLLAVSREHTLAKLRLKESALGGSGGMPNLDLEPVFPDLGLDFVNGWVQGQEFVMDF